MPIGRIVDAVPHIREEGDTTIMPVVEEILVVERRLILKEEVRIRRIHVSNHHREMVTLREQEAVITRVKAGNPELEDVRQPRTNKLTPGTKPTPNIQEKLK